jgi:hypothetical protein
MEARAVTAATEFRVLGPVEFILDGVAIHIGSSTQRTLLALLLIHRNEVVSTHRKHAASCGSTSRSFAGSSSPVRRKMPPAGSW